MNSKSFYDADFYGWTHQQADLLQTGNFTQLDHENLIEEIQSCAKGIGKSVRNIADAFA